MAEIMRPRSIGVAELNYYLKEYLAEDDFLFSVAVQGEVSGFRAHPSGHIYFTLREGEHSLKTVMWRRYASALHWQPKDGEQVVALGSVGLYERDGVCQLYAETLLPAGAGERARLLEELRRRLEVEGLFDPARKRPLPPFAQSVGVVTAADSAAWADIQRIAYSRWPQVQLHLYPALVQGVNAPDSLAAALAEADRGGHEVLICGRGGGGEEDLAAFDTETVVRAIATTKTPLISAVGHESDVSLADLAADVRAATPTHAAQLAVAEKSTILALLDEREQRLRMALSASLEEAESRLCTLKNALCFRDPKRLLERWQRRLDQAETELQSKMERSLLQREQALSSAAARLELLSPLAVLGRGYSIVEKEGGGAIRDASSIELGEMLTIRPGKGTILARAERIITEKGGVRRGKDKKEGL